MPLACLIRTGGVLSWLKCGVFCSVSKLDVGNENVIPVPKFSEGFGKGLRRSWGH